MPFSTFEAWLVEHWQALSLLAATAVVLVRFGRSVERINANVVGLRRSIVRNARRGARAQLHAARALGRLSARTSRVERHVEELRAHLAPNIPPPAFDDDGELGRELELVARELEVAAEEDEAELVELEAVGAR